MTSKKAKTGEEVSSQRTNAFEDSDNEESGDKTARERSPSPTRRKTPATPSQEANHAAAKKSSVATMTNAVDLMSRKSKQRAIQGSAPINVNNNSKYGETQMTALVVGYADSNTKHGKAWDGKPLEGNKMSVYAVPISMAPNRSFDMHGLSNPYMSGMIVTHRPKNADANSRTLMHRKDGSTYNASFPKCPTFIPNGEMFEGQKELLGFEGQIACVSNGVVNKMNRFELKTLKDTTSGKTQVTLPLPVGSLVTFTSITGEDTTRDGYNPKKGNPSKKPPIPQELDEACAKRVELEHIRAMSDRKFRLNFKNADGNVVNKLTPGYKYVAKELIDTLYKDPIFQEHVTIGLMSAHYGWMLKPFNEQDFAEEDCEETKLEYEAAKAAVAILQTKRKEELSKHAVQNKRNVQEWNKADNLKYQEIEPGFKEKVDLCTHHANELELAVKDEESIIKPWSMPYSADKYETHLVFKADTYEHGEHTHRLLKGEDVAPKMFTDFSIESVVPKSNGYGYMMYIHTMTVADTKMATDYLQKGITEAILDSRAWYSYTNTNDGYPPLVLSGNDGVFSVAWKVQSAKHLPIVANMMVTPYGNGIIGTRFEPRAPDSIPDEKCYINMMVPDVVGKLQSVGLRVSAEWLKKNLCDNDDDEFSLEPVSLEKNLVDVSKACAFANPTTSLSDDTFVNLHELQQGSVNFDKIADNKTKTLMKANNYHLEYRVLTPIGPDGELIDLSGGTIKTSFAHMAEFGKMSVEDAQALIEDAAKNTQTDEEDESRIVHSFLKSHTIPYAIMVDNNGESV